MIREKIFDSISNESVLQLIHNLWRPTHRSVLLQLQSLFGKGSYWKMRYKKVQKTCPIYDLIACPGTVSLFHFCRMVKRRNDILEKRSKFVEIEIPGMGCGMDSIQLGYRYCLIGQYSLIGRAKYYRSFYCRFSFLCRSLNDAYFFEMAGRFPIYTRLRERKTACPSTLFVLFSWSQIQTGHISWPSHFSYRSSLKLSPDNRSKEMWPLFAPLRILIFNLSTWKNRSISGRAIIKTRSGLTMELSTLPHSGSSPPLQTTPSHSSNSKRPQKKQFRRQKFGVINYPKKFELTFRRSRSIRVMSHF